MPLHQSLLPSGCERREPIQVSGWLVRFYNGAVMFATTDPMTWPPKIICKVRCMTKMIKTIADHNDGVREPALDEFQ